MKITAITRLKQGDIYLALKELGWSQSELARRTGMHPTEIGDIINLKSKPKFEKICLIEEAFAGAGIFINLENLWPDKFKAINNTFVQTKEIDDTALLEAGNLEESVDNKLMIEYLNEQVEKMDGKMKEAMKKRYFEDLSTSETAEEMGVSLGRVWQLEKKALKIIQGKVVRKRNKAKKARERIGVKNINEWDD